MVMMVFLHVHRPVCRDPHFQLKYPSGVVTEKWEAQIEGLLKTKCGGRRRGLESIILVIPVTARTNWETQVTGELN